LIDTGNQLGPHPTPWQEKSVTGPSLMALLEELIDRDIICHCR
jgi:hypothetical protein